MIPFLRWITFWVMYGCESWIIKKAEHWRIDAFELCCWRGHSDTRVSWTSRRSNWSIHWIFIGRTYVEAEAPIPDKKNWLIGKDPAVGKDWGQKKGVTEDKMVGWHHWLKGHHFKQTQGDSEGHRSLVCCSSWDHRVGRDLVTEQQQQELHLQWSHF